MRDEAAFPLVSIITPCYNSEDYLSRYLDSILLQDYPKIEQIIIDDGSTDHTQSIVHAYASKFLRQGLILIYHYQENMGLGGAINTGLKFVTGEYFAWCDSDNFYAPDYVSKNIKAFLDNPSCSVVRCDGYVVNDSDIKTPIALLSSGPQYQKSEKLFINAIMEKDFHFGCAMLKTVDFDRVNENREIFPSRAGQNWQLLLPMLYYYRSYYMDVPLFFFVVRKGSISDTSFNQSIEKTFATFNEHKEILYNTIIKMQIPEEVKILKMISNKYKKKDLAKPSK